MQKESSDKIKRVRMRVSTVIRHTLLHECDNYVLMNIDLVWVINNTSRKMSKRAIYETSSKSKREVARPY